MATIRIPLSQGYEAVIDEADYDLVSKYKWYAAVSGDGRVYAVTRLHMHRLIVDAPIGFPVDHIDGDPLNNASSNLRVCTVAQNQWNRRSSKGISGYKNVYWNNRKNKWIAQIMVHRKSFFGGYFDDPKEAAKRADELMKKHHGEYACLNFPDGKD